MAFEKQLAELTFDDGQGVYRGVVEYYGEGAPPPKPIVVPVEFAGEKDVTFAEIEKHAFQLADETLRSVVAAEH